VLGYSPLRTGLLFLPLGIGIGAGIGLSTALMPRLGVKAMLAIGFLGSAAGLLLASNIHVNSTYAGGILPGLIVFGVSSGICYPGLINGALHQVTGQDSGLASGVQTAMQQIGSALGLATLVTLALRYADSQIRHGVPPLAAQTHGYALSFRVGAVVLAAAGVLVLALLEHVTAKPRVAVAEITPDQPPAAQTAHSRAARQRAAGRLARRPGFRCEDPEDRGQAERDGSQFEGRGVGERVDEEAGRHRPGDRASVAGHLVGRDQAAAPPGHDVADHRRRRDVEQS